MKIRSRKEPEITRNPHLSNQKQSTFHYSSNRSPSLRSERNKDEGLDSEEDIGQSHNLRKFVFTLLAVFLLGFALFFSFLTAKPTISISNKEDALRNPEQYELTAAEASNDLRSASKLTINRQKISNDIQSAYPEIKGLDIATPFLSRGAVITIILAKPTVTLKSQNRTFVIDDQGKAILETTQPARDVTTPGLIEVDDQSNPPIQVGKQAFTARQSEFINELKRQSDAANLPMRSATMTAGGGELDVSHGDLDYFIKYNLYEDARKSFGTFAATKGQLEKTRVKPAEYIDVRLPERAYVK